MNKFLLGLLAMFVLVGCGDRVTINTGEVGKQLTVNGLESEIRESGSFRMESCWVTACPKVIRLQTAISATEVRINKVFLPKSNVTLDDVAFGIQFRVKQDRDSINSIFQDVRATEIDKREMLISSEMVFDTFIARKVPEAVISALREYTVEQALTNVDEIAKYVKDYVNKSLENTPVEVTEFGFPNGVGNPPALVLKAKEELYAIEEAKQRDIRALEAQLTIEDYEQAVQRKRASNDIEISNKLGVPVTEYMQLKVAEKLADAALDGTPVAVSGNIVGMSK